MVTVVSMVGLDYSNSVYDDNNEIEFNTIMKRKKHACEIVFVYKKKSEEEYSTSWYTAYRKDSNSTDDSRSRSFIKTIPFNIPLYDALAG